jgi:hypothetical protein
VNPERVPQALPVNIMVIRRESHQDELRRLLRKYGVEFDERYVWD